jgi:predicted ArsR family transcriptional regulator
MDELSVRDMAEKLNIPMDTVKSRLRALHIKPLRYIGQAAIYDPAALDLIREPKPRGRPKNK